MPNVVVTHPLAPRDNLDLYRQMGEAFGVQSEAEGLCDQFEVAYEKALAGVGKQQEVLYLVWRDPWMTVSSDTYIAQTLALFGWTQPAVASRAGRDKEQPERYPEVELADFAGFERVRRLHILSRLRYQIENAARMAQENGSIDHAPPLEAWTDFRFQKAALDSLGRVEE